MGSSFTAALSYVVRLNEVKIQASRLGQSSKHISHKKRDPTKKGAGRWACRAWGDFLIFWPLENFLYLHCPVPQKLLLPFASGTSDAIVSFTALAFPKLKKLYTFGYIWIHLDIFRFV